MEACPQCHRPFGLRRRCYVCTPARPRTGSDRLCRQCGKAFYVPRWVAVDAIRNSGAFCSRTCKYTAIRGVERVAGHTYVRKDGYRTVKVGIRQYQLEHRLVIEAALGRPLRRDEEVHHRNGDKLDNRLENLEILSPSEHQSCHGDSVQRRRTRVTVECRRCGRSFDRQLSRASVFCSNACRLAALHEGNRKR